MFDFSWSCHKFQSKLLGISLKRVGKPLERKFAEEKKAFYGRLLGVRHCVRLLDCSAMQCVAVQECCRSNLSVTAPVESSSKPLDVDACKGASLGVSRTDLGSPLCWYDIKSTGKESTTKESDLNMMEKEESRRQMLDVGAYLCDHVLKTLALNRWLFWEDPSLVTLRKQWQALSFVLFLKRMP